jgi:hypothetical protein
MYDILIIIIIICLYFMVINGEDDLWNEFEIDLYEKERNLEIERDVIRALRKNHRRKITPCEIDSIPKFKKPYKCRRYAKRVNCNLFWAGKPSCRWFRTKKGKMRRKCFNDGGCKPIDFCTFAKIEKCLKYGCIWKTDRCYSADRFDPTTAPSFGPIIKEPPPTLNPTEKPSQSPTTQSPTSSPTTNNPTQNPTSSPTSAPTFIPTIAPSLEPTTAPTSVVTDEPTLEPTIVPSFEPTPLPSV